MLLTRSKGANGMQIAVPTPTTPSRQANVAATATTNDFSIPGYSRESGTHNL